MSLSTPTNPSTPTTPSTSTPLSTPTAPALKSRDIVFRPVHEADAALLGSWWRHPASTFWQMQQISDDAAQQYLRDIRADEALGGWVAEWDGRVLAYVETYDPAAAVLVDVFDARPGDIGMHVLIEPAPEDPRRRLTGLTSAVMRAVVRHCIDRLGAARIVVEPDVENTAIAVKNAEVGFRVLSEVELADKTAALSVLEAHRAPGPEPDADSQPDAAPQAPAHAARGHTAHLNTAHFDTAHFDTGHLRPEYMEPAQRHLVAKASSEFFHERLLDAEPVSVDGTGAEVWEFTTDGGARYQFQAGLLPLRHLVIEEPTLVRLSPAGEQLRLDVQELVVELSGALGIPDHLMGTYLEELASTAASGAYKQFRGGPSAAQLARGRRDLDVAGDFQHTESAMTEGHPCFLASNGRIGFGVEDYLAYAPETGRRFRYQWYAARREDAHLALTPDRSEAGHWEEELSPATLEGFEQVVRGRGEDPADYLWVPVHPWQHDHRLSVSFAPDIARGDLIPLGAAGERYRPQQSIRTAFNADTPERSYIKTSLSIQNMGFLRGLSPEYMRKTPAINAWAADVVRSDEGLQGLGFDVLREHAAVGYTGDAYHDVAARSAQQKMIAALWRESPLGRAGEGERLMTLAALLHQDAEGGSVLAELIDRSGVDATSWVRELLVAYVAPVLRCLEVHELAFMAHGENIILRLREGRVVGAFMKDIGEEAAVIGERAIPQDISRIRHRIDDAEAAQLIFTDIVDGVLRHLQTVLHRSGVLPPQRLWSVLSEVIADHRASPRERRRAMDLAVPSFAHSCLNRLQLRNTLEMVDIGNASESMIHVAELENPLRSRSLDLQGAR